MDKFRAAEAEGRVDLEPAEAEFLARYRRVQSEMSRGHDPEEFPNPLLVVAYTFLDLLSKQKREVIFGHGKAIELTRRRNNTTEGQLDAAYREASELNQKYDELAENVRRSVEQFETFVQSINQRSERPTP